MNIFLIQREFDNELRNDVKIEAMLDNLLKLTKQMTVFIKVIAVIRKYLHVKRHFQSVIRVLVSRSGSLVRKTKVETR